MKKDIEKKSGADAGYSCGAGFVYTVKKGDTLYKIGKKYGVSVWALLFANPYVDVYSLRAGDELCVPHLPDFFLKNSKTPENGPAAIDKNEEETYNH